MSHNTSITASISPSDNKHHVVVHDPEIQDTVTKKVYSTVGIFGDSPSTTEFERPEASPKKNLFEKLKTLLLTRP